MRCRERASTESTHRRKEARRRANTRVDTRRCDRASVKCRHEGTRMGVPWPPGILEESSRGNRYSRQKGPLRPVKATAGSIACQRKEPGRPMNQSGSTITRKWPRTLGHTPIVPSCHQEVHSFCVLRHVLRAQRCPGCCEGVVLLVLVQSIAGTVKPRGEVERCEVCTRCSLGIDAFCPSPTRPTAHARHARRHRTASARPYPGRSRKHSRLSIPQVSRLPLTLIRRAVRSSPGV